MTENHSRQTRASRRSVGTAIALAAAILGGVLATQEVASAQEDVFGEGAFRDDGFRSASSANSGEIRGFIELIDRAELAAAQNGIVAFEVPEPGTRVSRGQVIARLDDRVPRANLAVAKAQAASDVDVRVARAIVRVARKEVASAQQANRAFPNTVTPQEVERLKLTETRSDLDIEKAETEYEIAAAREAEAEAVLSTFEIAAPFDGIIRTRFKQRGEAVRQGDPIVELVSRDRVKVRARVPLNLVRRLREGQTVRVIPIDEQDPTPMTGVIRLVDVFSDADPGSTEKLIYVTVEVPNPNGQLIPGLRANIEL